jgi:hypothetical protein
MTKPAPTHDAPTPINGDHAVVQSKTSGSATVVAFPARRRASDPALPEGHVLPPMYEWRQGSIWHAAPRQDRNGDPISPLLTRVTYGPLTVARMCSSAAGEQWFDLEWADGPRTVTRRVDGAVLRSGRALVRELGSAGIPVIDADAKHVERYLAAYLVANSRVLDRDRVTIARHLGWQEDGTTFVTADGSPWPVEPGEVEQKSALAGHHPKGTLKEWQDAVARVERYPVVRVVLAAAFAPILLMLLGLVSCTLDISGRSTRGKSTAATLGLSAWASPTTHGGALATWKSGIIMIEKRLNLVRGLPVVLDETRVVKSPEIVDQILYQVPMDHGAARGGGWASMLPWQTILISTGEQPALSFTSHEGAAARVLSLRRAPFGVDGERSAADAKAVTAAIAENYGHAGPAFAKRLIEVLAEDGGAQRLRDRHADLVTEHSQAARNDVARRRAPHVAALHLAAQLAHEWKIVPLPALETAVWVEQLGEESAREDRGGMALDVVRSLIAAQNHRLFPLNGQAAAVENPPGAGWIGARIEHKGVPAVAILPEALAAALGRSTPPIALDAVREAWAERGTIILDGKYNPRVPMDGGRPRAYVFALHTLDGDDLPDGSADTPPETEPDTEPEAVAELQFEQTELGAEGWPQGSIGDLANRQP